jgi:excisionase family DNA binding protein
MNLITTEQAATELGVTRRRVQALIQSGRLKATKVGRVYVIRPKDLEAVRVRKPGRQPKGD